MSAVGSPMLRAASGRISFTFHALVNSPPTWGNKVCVDRQGIPSTRCGINYWEALKRGKSWQRERWGWWQQGATGIPVRCKYSSQHLHMQTASCTELVLQTFWLCISTRGGFPVYIILYLAKTEIIFVYLHYISSRVPPNLGWCRKAPRWSHIPASTPKNSWGMDCFNNSIPSEWQRSPSSLALHVYVCIHKRVTLYAWWCNLLPGHPVVSIW